MEGGVKPPSKPESKSQVQASEPTTEKPPEKAPERTQSRRKSRPSEEFQLDLDDIDLDYTDYLEEDKPEAEQQQEKKDSYQPETRELYTGLDYRMPWLKRQTCLYLNEHDQDIFDEMLLNENIKNGIVNYFNADLSDYPIEDVAKMRAVFFYKMFVEEEHDSDNEDQEEEEEEEETDEFLESSETTSKKKKKKKKGSKGKKKKKKKKKGKKKKKKSKSSSKGKKKKKKGKKKKKKKKKKKGKKSRSSKTSKSATEDETTATSVTFPWDDDTDLDVDSLPDDSKKKRYFEFAANHLPKYFSKINPLTMYMVRASRISVPIMRSMDEAQREMPKHLMFGNLVGCDLVGIHAVLKKVFKPIVTGADLNAPVRRMSQTKFDSQPLTEQQQAQLKEELQMQLDSFLGTLERAISQMQGEIKLTIPSSLHDLRDIPDGNLAEMAKNKQFVAELEKVALMWEQEIARIIDDLPKVPKENTPLSTLEMWRDRNALLAAIYDQIQTPEVRKLTIILAAANSDILPGFEYQKQEFMRNLQESRDITRFLGTIERHLKTITYSHSFVEMEQAMPHIMEGLQLIWMLSRHIREDRMLNMLEMIGKLLFDRVTAVLHPSVLFKRDPIQALDLSDSARTLLITWKDSYMRTRDLIEQSGKGQRWEFDRSKLFPKTDYAAVIAQHLSEIAVVLLEFQNFFGPEIKAVVGDPKKIEEALKKAYLLVKPFVDVTFDPFLQSNSKLWAELLDQLRKDVQILESEAKAFIDEAFVTIKSADAAFEMLMKFKHIETRDGIHAKLMRKFDDTLMIYIQEVKNVKEFYDNNKSNPLLLKYTPPIAGRIWWVRALFYHIKKTIITFRAQHDVISTEIGQLACQEYLTLAREMRHYEEFLYQQFNETANKTMVNIRKNVFKRVPAKDELGAALEVSKNKKILKVNLPSSVMEACHEALHLEQMGYRISESVRNVALQRNQYIKNSRSLGLICKNYYVIRRNLRPAETELMEKPIREIEKQFEQGLLRLNWTAISIPAYADELNTAVQRFEGIVNQVNKVAKDIRTRLWTIKNAKLYIEPPYKTEKHKIDILDCWDFFVFWEKYRGRTWEKLLLQFRGLPPLFLKLETLIYNSSTGKLKQFRPYFAQWERRIFQFMSKFIVRTLYDFEKRMMMEDPLFDVDAILHQPEIRLTPTPHEIYNMVMNGARDCVTGTKKFVRWMRGTCIETPGINQGPDQEKFIYSYYLDIGRLPRVLQLLLRIQENVQILCRQVWDHLKKYRMFKNLWRFNKEKTVETFASKNPSIKIYDDKMAFYTMLSFRVSEMPQTRIIGMIRINLVPLQTAICKHAREWVMKLGAYLLASTKELNSEFDRIVTDYENDLKILPRTIDDLKTIFTTIDAIMEATIAMEARYQDLTQRFSCLKMYEIDVEIEELVLLEETWKRWQVLWLHEVKVVGKRIEPLKTRFAKMAKSMAMGGVVGTGGVGLKK